jgi:predicted RNA-binding Zn-ribbon protein involved in translation (DUF1610 family)
MSNENRVRFYCGACGNMILECPKLHGIYISDEAEKCNKCGSQDIELDIIPEEN